MVDGANCTGLNATMKDCNAAPTEEDTKEEQEYWYPGTSTEQLAFIAETETELSLSHHECPMLLLLDRIGSASSSGLRTNDKGRALHTNFYLSIFYTCRAIITVSLFRDSSY